MQRKDERYSDLVIVCGIFAFCLWVSKNNEFKSRRLNSRSLLVIIKPLSGIYKKRTMMDEKQKCKLKRELTALFRSIGDDLRLGESVDRYFDKATPNADDFKELLASEDFEILDVERTTNRILTKIAIFTENDSYQNAWIRLLDLSDAFKIYAIGYREINRSVLDQDNDLRLGIERPAAKSLIADLLKSDDDYEGGLENC
jgi:hypothetical protein